MTKNNGQRRNSNYSMKVSFRPHPMKGLLRLFDRMLLYRFVTCTENTTKHQMKRKQLQVS